MAKIGKIALIFLFFSVLPAVASAATLYFSPSSGSYAAGSVVTANIYVSSVDQAMNAASGVISFPADKLSVEALSKSGSVFSLWVQEPSFSNSAAARIALCTNGPHPMIATSSLLSEVEPPIV